MSSSPGGLGDSYFRHSRTETLPHSPISHTTSYSYDQPYINGSEVLLEEITQQHGYNRSLDQVNDDDDHSPLEAYIQSHTPKQNKRKETTPISPNSSSKLTSSPQPRRWRLIPATCTCPVHGTSADYGVGNSSFTEEDYHHSRFSASSRSKVLDEELDKLKGSVHQLESEVLQSKGMPSRRSTNKTNGTHSYRSSSFRERTEIETTRKELESELKGWQGKLVEQLEALKKKLETETTQRNIKEHDLASKIHQCERLQHQLDDAHKRLNLQEDRISELTAAKNKAKERLQEVLDERDMNRSRESETSKKFSEEMRRVLEHEMEVRVRVETELQNLQKLVEREMGEAVDARKELNAKKRELESTRRELETSRETTERLEREIRTVRSSTHTDKSRYSEELEQKELDCQQLREQLQLVTTQLEREREQHGEQMREKIQELNRLQQELLTLQKRVAELEAQLDKTSNKHRQSDGETAQFRSKILDLETDKGRLEAEVTQLQERVRALERERERMLDTIHDLTAQLDALQSKPDGSVSGEERNRHAQIIRDLEAQIEEMNNKYNDARDSATKWSCEVDETNSALDEVRTALEREMALRMEGDKLFEEEVRQWREKANEWEQERAKLNEQGGGYDNARLEQMEKDIERIEVERLQELDERDEEIRQLRERIVELEAGEGAGSGNTDKSQYEERMKMQVQGFQDQLKDLCIQLDESESNLDKETKARQEAEKARQEAEKARQDAEAGKKRLEKALLELNSKLQAASPKPSRDSDSQISSLKHKLAQVEEELSRSKTLDPFEFDPDLIASDNDSIEESDEEVRVRLSDIQRALRKLNEFSASSNSISRYTHEISSEHHEEHHEDHYDEEHQPNGHHHEEEEEEEPEEDQEEQDPEQEEEPEEEQEEQLEEPEPEQEEEEEEQQEEEQEEPQEEQEEEEEEEQEQHEDEEQEEEQEEEVVHDEEPEEEEQEEAISAPTTPNGTKRVRFGDDMSPPVSPHAQQPPAVAPPTTPPSTRPTPTPALPSNDAERERLDREWKRKVASSANRYTHSRIPIQSSLRLYPQPNEAPDSPPKPARANDHEAIKQKIESIRRSNDFTPTPTPKTPEKPVQALPPAPGPAPGFYYVPVKSDEIDEELSKVVSTTEPAKLADIPQNFTRLEKGVYQFGLKKIHMQINNGSLVVRVGGGFMLFVEYLARHAKVENVKFQRDEARKRFTTPKKEEPPRELPRHNDTIQMGTLVRRGPKLMLVTKD